MTRFLPAVLAGMFAVTPSVCAGPLKDFEDSATKAQSGEPRHERRSEHHHDAMDGEDRSGLWSSVAQLVVVGIVYGGAASLQRVRPPTDTDQELEPRRPGEALIPLVRADGGYQFVRGGVSAVEFRGEVGYALAALQVRHTAYWDRRSDEALSTTMVQALYRMSLGSRIELDLGGGLFVLKGGSEHSGSSLTMPVIIRPTEHFGFELRPTWCSLEGHTLRDYAATVHLGGRYASVFGGYRWLNSGASSLDGPEAGLTLAW